MAAAVRLNQADIQGSSVQLPSYNYSKYLFKKYGIIKNDGFAMYLAASGVSGVFVVSPGWAHVCSALLVWFAS